LGAGLGHLVPLLPLAKGLTSRGHRVFAAMRDLSTVDTLFAGLGVSYLQAPFKIGQSRNLIRPTRSFAHIMHNCGFGDIDELRALTVAWQNLYDYVRPDLIIFDYSPAALLAAWGRNVRRLVTGNGFFCPPDESPFPDLARWLPDDPDRLYQDERAVLARVNRLLEEKGAAPLERLAQLFHQVDATVLATFRELDHYPSRKGAEYWGVWPDPGGKPPVWPKGEGKKVYAYLKPFPTLANLLALLKQLRCPTVVFDGGIDLKLQRRFQCGTLRFERQRLNMVEASRRCDMAILNAGHGATAAMLMAGKPILQLPTNLEQVINGASVVRLGAGLSVRIRRPEDIAVKLMSLLHSEKFASAAQRFADKYADFDPQQRIEKALSLVDGLLEGSSC